MLSCAPSVHPSGLREGFQLNIIDGMSAYSKRRQPSDEISIVAPFLRATFSPEQGLCFGHCFAFRFQIEGEILISGIDTHMPQPMGDCAEVNA